jgi:hypothetical protein
MKNTLKLKAIRKIAGIIVLVTVIGFSMAACSDDNGTPPTLHSINIGTWDSSTNQLTPKTTFSSNEIKDFRLRFQGDDPNKDIKKVIFTFKKGSTVDRSIDWDYSSHSSYPFTSVHGFGSYPSSAGDYTVEVQAIDSKGNKSNILSASFTVK